MLENDSPGISYYDVDNKHLKFARLIGEEWQSEVVDTATNVGQYTSIAYSNIFNLGVSYYDATNTSLKYANYVGSLETGLVSGIVTDIETGLPINGAVAILTGNIESTAPTNTYGEYRIFNVPFGTGYHITIAAGGYITQELEDFDITEANRSITIDAGLYQSNITPVLSELDPDPNPDISVVRQGGNAHRHYETIDSLTGDPAPLVNVTVVDEDMVEYVFTSDISGIVDIVIPSSMVNNGNVGDSYDFSITKIRESVIDPPVSFTCEVISPEYQKYWDNNQFGKLGVSFLSVDFNRGSSVMLTENNTNTPGAETLFVTRQARAGVGVDFSVGAEAGVNCGPVTAGAGASAGIGGSVSGITEDYYQFPHQNYNSNQALVQYLLFADGNYNSLDNTLIRLLSKIEKIFGQQSTLEAAYLGDKKGIDVKVEASAQANIGIGVDDVVGIGADANVGAEGHAIFNVVHHDQLGENEYNFGLSGNLSASADAGLTFNIPLYENEDKEYDWELEFQPTLNIFDYSGTRGFEFSIIKDAQTGDFKKYRIKFLHRNEVSGWEEVMTYEIAGSEVYEATQTFREQFSQISILNNPSSSSGTIQISNDLFSQLSYALFNTLYDLQVNDQGDATISFHKDIREITDIDGFEISIKGKLGASLLQAEIGGGVGFEEGKMMTSEKGKWVWGHHLTLEDYGNHIPDINEEYKDVVQDIVNEIPLWIRLSLGVFNKFSWLSREDAVFYITDTLEYDTVAYISLPPESLPTTIDYMYCVSWGWYGT